MKKTDKIKKVLKKLNKTEEELGEYCIDKVADALKANGYSDAKLWATNILSAMLGDLKMVEGSEDIQDWALDLDGPERDAVEAIYETFTNLEDALQEINPKDIKEAIVQSVSKTIEIIDKNKYKKLYG